MGATGGIRLDPRTKLILLVAVNLLMTLPQTLLSETAIMLFCAALLFLSGRIAAALLFLAVYGGMTAGGLYIVPHFHGIVALFANLLFVSFKKFLPCLALGTLLVKTTRIGEFIAALERLGVKDTIIIPFAVMLRFFPTVNEEWGYINRAMKMRGIGASIGGVLRAPVKTIEYILVPLLSSSVTIGEELSAASLSRGLGNPVRRTTLCELGLGVRDRVVLCCAAALAVLVFVLGRGTR
ncbi:MAG: energy-coupling factor transporter transmembrane protein EcfT [Treponema sp.]|jgi:energy-coupling factor transport system permease protein|nr:energy-coupling factor transporter transmembrane protein EcfT [Treponema sp.]